MLFRLSCYSATSPPGGAWTQFKLKMRKITKLMKLTGILVPSFRQLENITVMNN